MKGDGERVIFRVRDQASRLLVSAGKEHAEVRIHPDPSETGGVGFRMKVAELYRLAQACFIECGVVGWRKDHLEFEANTGTGFHLGPGGFTGYEWHDGKIEDCQHEICRERVEHRRAARLAADSCERHKFFTRDCADCESMGRRRELERSMRKVSEGIARARLHICRDGKSVGQGLRKECDYCRGVSGGHDLASEIAELQKRWLERELAVGSPVTRLDRSERLDQIRIAVLAAGLVILALMLWRVW